MYVPGAHVGEKRVLAGSPGIVVSGGCESTCVCWWTNSGPLEEQPVFLTAEPSFQALIILSTVCLLNKHSTTELKP